MIFVIFLFFVKLFWNSKIQKNHEISKNRPKIEFWCFYRSKSPSFGNYEFFQSFWCIYHSYNSFFHLVWICRRRPPDTSKMLKILAEFRRICMMFKKLGRKCNGFKKNLFLPFYSKFDVVYEKIKKYVI